MEREYWLRQEQGKALFPELQWSRPEHRTTAGKLLVIGGNLHGFAAPALAYGESLKAGIGTCHVLLPAAIRKYVGVIIEHADYAASTPASGSFSQQALGEFLQNAAWADGVLLAGDLGRNSETAILLEKFLQKYHGLATITKDAVDYVASSPDTTLTRENTLLVASFSQLQRLGIAAKFEKPLTFGMDLMRLTEWLHDFTLRHRPFIIVKHHEYIAVAVNGRVSTTKLTEDASLWRVRTAAHATVWWLQNPAKPLEALTTAIV
jgi:ADP-dependent NAD(P)H-hydrate dehydratase / NAD(P)H-hydrate epimerase